MKMNITVDLSELFKQAQEDAIETAEVEGDYDCGSYIAGFEEVTLKDAVQERIIQQCSSDIDRSALNSAIKKLCLKDVDLDKRFDSIAKENISSSVDKKVNEWVYTGVIDVGEKQYLVNDLIKSNLKEAIGRINSKYKVNSFEDAISKMVNEKVSKTVSNYESMIKKEVDMVAKSIIQEKVSETLTATFAHMMQFNTDNILTKN